MVRGSDRGFTFIELLVVTTILIILASAIMPLARVTLQREREVELHRALREIRMAIDKYKDAVDTGQIGSTDIRAGSEGYPPDLETLVEGVSKANDASGIKLKFLRRVPMDPIDALRRMGHALVPGQAGLEQLGRPERLRRVLEGGRHGARRHEIQGLVRTGGAGSFGQRRWAEKHRCLERGREVGLGRLVVSAASR